MKIHIKGYILQQLAHHSSGLWDTELSQRVCLEYDKPENDYWFGTVRACLADLSASGLILFIAEKPQENDPRLLFQYQLSALGRQRMRQTGLHSA